MTKILVAGEVNADFILTGLPSLPVIGQELIGDGFKMVTGGSSGITAVRLAALGANVDFSGILGNDATGQFLIDQLQAAGIGCDHLQMVDIPTGITLALTYSHDRALVTYPGTIDQYDGSNINSDMLSDYKHIHVGSFFLQKALQSELARIFEIAHGAGLTTSLDVGWDPQEQWMNNPYLRQTLGHVDYFFPNEDEVAALTTGSDIVNELAGYVGGNLIVKQGAQGATIYDKNGKQHHYPAFPADVVDTTGAGDAFNAGFLYASCVEKLSMQKAMTFAAACGAHAVTQVGGTAGAPTATHIYSAYLQENQS